MKQRGITGVQFLLYAGVALAVIAAAWGAIAWHANVHFERGEASKHAEWDKQKLADAALERARGKEVGQALLLVEKARMAAENKAREYEDKWKEARRANRGKPLAVCEDARSAAPAPGAYADVAAEPAVPGIRPAGVADDRLRVRLLWRFVGMHDGAFTGLDGQPLFGAASGYALDSARADTASPYTLDDALDVAAENAFKLSACRRDVASARRKVEEAAAAWDRAKQ